MTGSEILSRPRFELFPTKGAEEQTDPKSMPALLVCC
jgi:hypothetical protein